MSDIDGQELSSEPTVEPTAAPEVQQEESHSPEQQQSPNPFWGEVEQAVGPNVWKVVQPHLAKADAEANRRIAAVNEQLKPWKTFADQGVTPENVQQAFGYVQQLNDPQGQVEIYQSLHNFLKENGRLPETPQEIQEVVDGAEEEDPRDRQIRELQEQLGQFGQYTMSQFEAQEHARIVQEADSWAANEWQRVAQANPEFSKEDFRDIAQVLAAQSNQGQEPNLDQAVATFVAMRDRIRTAPRPGQLAPRLPSGPGGGTPSGDAIDPSKLSRQQRIELATQTLSRGK